MVLRDLFLKAFHFKKREKGARQIKMVLSYHFNTLINLTCIRPSVIGYSVLLILSTISDVYQVHPFGLAIDHIHSSFHTQLNYQFKIILSEIRYFRVV